jgi:Cys-tRNA(Pro)/Cys-tRNA(Cys) deacylase
MMTTTPVTHTLDSLNIPYRLHLHAMPLRSLEQAASERGLVPDQIVRSLVFRLENENYILVLMPGPGKVDWPKLRHHLGVSRITTADADEVLKVTGYEIGAVSPFGLPAPLRILADNRIRDHETISIGAGIRNAGIILQRDDLLNAIQPEMGDFSA